jgi:hypothetical protein
MGISIQKKLSAIKAGRAQVSLALLRNDGKNKSVCL